MQKKVHPYETLQVNLANLIAQTPAGERLPTEPLLAQRLGVSRATLREAMRSFESQGLIRRRQGIGTFVVGRPQVIESGLEVLESIETLADRILLEVSMEDLIVHQIHADADQADALNVSPNAPLIRVSRIIRADNRPVASLIDILPLDVLTIAELQSEFSGSVLDLLLRRGYPALSYSNTEIRVVNATSEIARDLEIQRGDALLLFVARLYNTSGRVIDYSYSYFLPGYFRFHVVRSVGGIPQPLIGFDPDRR
jgi:GntR family transcriptional regulator